MARSAVAAAFFVGCSTIQWVEPRIDSGFDPPAVAYVCIDLPDREAAAAERAVSAWDKALAGWRRLVSVKAPVGSEGCAYWIGEVPPGDAPPGVAAWVSSLGGRTVNLVRGHYEDIAEKIVLHEMGHALGAQHVDGTLMHPVRDEVMLPCPDVTTVAQVAAWNKVDLRVLGWCAR